MYDHHVMKGHDGGLKGNSPR